MFAQIGRFISRTLVCTLIGMFVGVACGAVWGALIGIFNDVPTREMSAAEGALVSAVWEAWYGGFLGLAAGFLFGIISSVIRLRRPSN